MKRECVYSVEMDHHSIDGALRPQLPLSDRNLVACRGCGLILTLQQFKAEGCQTCALDPLEHDDEVAEHTTRDFAGFVGVVSGEGSWVARLLGKTGVPCGVYAAQISATEVGGDDVAVQYDGGLDDHPGTDVGYA